jgi:succinoglycan biosynthesis transport protein ExoP
MTFFEYLSILRRRWLYLAVGLLAGAGIGFLTAPGGREPIEEYTATHTLLVDMTTPSGANLNLQQSALLADTGPVPILVEEQLAGLGLPPALTVKALADLDLRSLAVTATATNRKSAAKAADLTAEAIVDELTSAEQAVYDNQLSAANEQIDQVEDQLAGIDEQLAGLALEDPARAGLQSERDGLEASIVGLRTQVQDLESRGEPDPPLTTLEAASARPVDGWSLPTSGPARAALLGGLGLVLGLIGALVADRLDTRVRGKDDAERAFDLPVIAEIPPMGGSSGRERELLVATKPASPFVESFRALRTVVLYSAAERSIAHAQTATNGAGTDGSHGNGTTPHQAVVVLITSPSAGEGKSTTAAHLAGVLAEAGRHTLVISADFRRPRIHEYFGVPREPGLSDVLDTGTGRIRLSDLQMATTYPGVHLLPSGGPVDNPAQLLAESAALIAAARQLFDYIIIDTPPLLVANDATELAGVADFVIMVAKADRTSRDSSRRASEVLRRVDAPLLGVVISAAHDTPTAYGYYRYRYYSETDQGPSGRKRRRRDAAAEDAAADVDLDVDEADEVIAFAEPTNDEG